MWKLTHSWALYYCEIPQAYYVLGKGGYIFSSICLSSVCLLVTLLKKYEQVAMKFYGWVRGDNRKNFSGTLDHYAHCSIRNPAIIQQVWVDFNEIFRITKQRYKKQFIRFFGWFGSPCWLSKSGTQAIWGQWATATEVCTLWMLLLLHVMCM